VPAAGEWCVLALVRLAHVDQLRVVGGERVRVVGLEDSSKEVNRLIEGVDSGRWVGLGYDGRIMTGWAAMGQTQEEAEGTMQKLIASEGVPYVND